MSAYLACRIWDPMKRHWRDFTLPADDRVDAERICGAMNATARVDGELVASVGAPDWLLRLGGGRPR